jgi:pilus assembly protein CpaB
MIGSVKKPGDSSRRSRRWALAWMLLALFSGLAATVAIGRFLRSKSTSAAQAFETSEVVVAAKEIPLGATITEDMVKVVPFPKGGAPKGGLQEASAAVGRVPKAALIEGEPILEARLAPKEAGTGFAALIPKDMRAMAVKVNEVIGVAGFIHPNDWVDVIAVMAPDNSVEPRAKVILQRVQVFAVGVELEPAQGQRDKPKQVTVVTLLVTPEESERLALAALRGKIQLALRTQLDDEEVATPGIDPRRLVEGPAPPATDKIPKASSRIARRAPPRQAEPTPSTDVVEVFHGHKLEERRIRAASAVD